MALALDALCASSVDAALVYDTFNASSSSAAAAGFLLFDNAAAAAAFSDAAIAIADAGPAPAQLESARPFAAGDDMPAPAPARRKRRRRARSCKSREESECQRMTHIAVERNRRRQMNEYLVVLRSLMPDSYVQRGDQASIVGGAIDFVKELEQQLQSLEAQKRSLVHHNHKAARRDAMPMRTAAESSASNCSSSSVTTEDWHRASSPVAAALGRPPFAGFFTYPQYVWCLPPQQQQAAGDSSSGATMLSEECGRAGVADVEVSLVETHASVRVMAPRRPGQLLRMVAGLQALRLAVLHLNVVSALDSLVLYSLSLKVEEGCGLTTADDIAAAVHHVLCFIHAEAASQQLVAAVQ